MSWYEDEKDERCRLRKRKKKKIIATPKRKRRKSRRMRIKEILRDDGEAAIEKKRIERYQ